MDTPAETSMKFDLSTVAPFFGYLMSQARIGMQPSALDRVVTGISALEVSSSGRWPLALQLDGAPHEIEVQAFMDNFEAPILFLSGDPLAIAFVDRTHADFRRYAGL